MTREVSYVKTKRIASNTLVLFVRMFILTIINLYAIRLILNGLGEEDYGIFNTIAGVVTATNVFSGVLALSIQRFYSYSMGKGDINKLQDIFSASMNIIIILAFTLCLFLESVGLWFIHTQLVIPEARIDASIWIYHMSVAILIISMLQMPFTAALFSHEDMGVYTIISTIECILKLLVACSIQWFPADHLVLYVLGLLLTSIIIALLYVTVCYWKYDECHYRQTKNKTLYKDLLSFSGWTFFGTIASTGMIQGNSILLNIFFGPLIVAAFGIALQINNALNSLCSSMVLAFRPPMIKAYAEQQYDYLNQLFSAGNKFIFYTLLAIAIPLIINMEIILSLWLDNTSPSIVLFCRLIIIYIVFMALHNPITTIMQASGHIKEYHLSVESITLLCLPLTWIFFHLGMPAYSVFVSMTGICIIAQIARLVCLRHFYNYFSITSYLKEFVAPALAMSLIGIAIAIFVHNYTNQTQWNALLSCIYIPVLIIMAAYMVGISRHERQLLTTMIKNTISRRRCQK